MFLSHFRLLEHYILHGPDPDALVKVIAQLDDPNRKNPQELDKGMAAHLRKVMTLKDTPHKEAVLTAFKNDWGEICMNGWVLYDASDAVWWTKQEVLYDWCILQ